MLIADVSNVNGEVNFATLKSAGVKAVWLKVTEGLTFNDKDYPAFKKAANKAGLRVGGYHFAHPADNSAISEATHFARNIGRLGRRDLRPVLDFETPAPHLPPIAMETWIKRFNSAIKLKLGVVPAFYSYGPFIEELKLVEPVGDGLWLAAYSRNDGKDYPFAIPHPWKKVIAHQFTSKWTVAGHSGYIDLSYVPKLRAVLAHPVLGL